MKSLKLLLLQSRRKFAKCMENVNIQEENTEGYEESRLVLGQGTANNRQYRLGTVIDSRRCGNNEFVKSVMTGNFKQIFVLIE
jgi:RPA family protein